MGNKRHGRAPLKPKTDGESTRKSAIALAELVVNAKGVIPKHQRNVHNHVLWKLTEADHPKHRLPLRSRQAHKVILAGGNLGKHLRHEHVYPRAQIVGLIMNDKGAVRALLGKYAVACVVHKDEAKRLDQDDRADKKNGVPYFGWSRYERTGLDIIEVQPDGSEQPFEFPSEK